MGLKMVCEVCDGMWMGSSMENIHSHKRKETKLKLDMLTIIQHGPQ